MSVYYEGQICHSTHKGRFLNKTQILLVPPLLHHKSSTVGQPNVQIRPTHLDVICMEVPIDSDGSSREPIWEIGPVWWEIDSRLWTGGAENGERARSRRLVLINCSKTF